MAGWWLCRSLQQFEGSLIPVQARKRSVETPRYYVKSVKNRLKTASLKRYGAVKRCFECVKSDFYYLVFLLHPTLSQTAVSLDYPAISRLFL